MDLVKTELHSRQWPWLKQSYIADNGPGLKQNNIADNGPG